MKFEEALALMRKGKTVLDPYGQEVTLENGMFMIQTYLFNPPTRGYITQFNDKCILGEWTLCEEPKFQYLWRHKGSTDWKGIITAKFASEEEALESFTYPKKIEVRRIEP